MKNGIIYISYDDYDYVNYFHLIIDDEFVLKYVPNEEIDEIFRKLDQMGIEDSNIAWCIVADQDAVNWEYEKAFFERGRKINCRDTMDFSNIPTLLKNEFCIEFTLDNSESADKYLCMYYPKQNKEDIPSKTKKIFDNIEITEFAKIILEKYERMCRHE